MFAIQEAQLEKAMQEARDERKQKEEALQEKEKILYKLARLMKKNNASIEDIVEETGLSRVVIEQL
ncbi:MAG: hypothetical protein AB8G86_20575 [Saprospiraceae bacterium]